MRTLLLEINSLIDTRTQKFLEGLFQAPDCTEAVSLISFSCFGTPF